MGKTDVNISSEHTNVSFVSKETKIKDEKRSGTSWQTMLSLIALGVSAIALIAVGYICCKSKYDLCFDDLSAVIAAFGFITAALIGMQIWNVLQFGKRIKEVEDKILEDSETREGKILKKVSVLNDLVRFDSSGAVFDTIGNALFNAKFYDSAFIILCNALQMLYNGSKDKEFMHNAIPHTEFLIYQIASKPEYGFKSITDTDRSNCLYFVGTYYSDKSKRAIIMKFISELEREDDIS